MNKATPIISMNQRQIEFILKRAWRVGKITHKEVVEIFGMSARTASRKMNQLMSTENSDSSFFIDNNGTSYLVRKGQSFVPNKQTNVPKCADLEDFKKHIHLAYDPSLFYLMTGVKVEEMNLNYQPWINTFPKNNNVFKEVYNSLIGLTRENPRALKIRYISLNPGDNGSESIIIPLGMQLINNQISIHSLKIAESIDGNISDIEPVNRTYVISRIQDCQKFNIKNIKKKYKIPTARELKSKEMKSQSVNFNPELTAEQISVLKHELNVPDLKVKLPQTMMFQFLRMYSNQPVNGIWPPLKLPQENS